MKSTQIKVTTFKPTKPGQRTMRIQRRGSDYRSYDCPRDTQVFIEEFDEVPKPRACDLPVARKTASFVPLALMLGVGQGVVK